jgi:hypothetical protein
MSQQIINVGTAPNDGLGTPIRTAFQYTNNNFTQLFSLPNPNPPSTLAGKAGDVPGMYAYSSAYFYYCFGTYVNSSTIIWAQIAQGNTASTSSIANGTSNVTIGSANANVTVGVTGTSNIAVFSNTGVSITGNIKTSGQVTATGNVYGNIVVGNYLYGDGSNISNISGGAGNYSNANVAEFLPVYSGNILLSGMSVTGNIDATLGNIQAFAYYTYNNISAAGNIRGGNLKTAGEVSAAGNVTGSYILGDGSQLTGIPASYTDANVAAFLPVYGGNILLSGMSVTGNIDAALGNIQAFAYYTYNNVSAAGNIRGGNFKTAGEVSAAGNVIGSYILGDGSQLTGIPASYTDANVAAFLPTYTGNLSVAAINITGNIIPTANAVYSLGNATNQWADLYVSNSSIHIGNQVLTTYRGNLFYNSNLVFTGSGTSSNITANVTGTTTGLHNGLVDSFDIKALSWDFGYIAANTYTNPIQYLFRVTSAGNIDMGTCTAPAALYIDIGTINASTVN